MFRFLFVVSVWSFILTTAGTADLRKDLAKCAIVRGELDRLACFDRIAKEAGVDGPQALPIEVTGTGKWRVRRDKNPIDDSERVVIVLTAESGKGRLGRPVTLVARCQSKKTEVYIDWETYVGDDSRSVYEDWKWVTVRIGSGPAEKQKWGISTSKDSTFAPNWAGNLLKQMSKSDRLIVQLTPYGESPITAIFATAGLSSALEPLANACGWKVN